MILNIDIDIDEQIRKCDELLARYEKLEERTKQLHFITIREFAKMRGCSVKIAQDLFNLHDFPSEDFGKEKVVTIEALRNWYMQKRKKSDYE